MHPPLHLRRRICALALLLGLTLAPSPSIRAQDADTAPIIFVHGYSLGGLGSCPAVNLQMWQPVMRTLRKAGWQGPLRAVGFYSCDRNVGTAPDDWIDDYGHPQVYDATAPCSPLCASQEWRHHSPLRRLAANRNTDLRHLAFHLAWYLYDTFTRSGVPVNIVAHSMGGLIVRWMLYAEQHNATIGQGVFPPQLVVRTVYTISTPHNGMAAALLGGTTQAEQMFAGSPFIHALNQPGGRDPQGTGGTTWITMGNYPADRDRLVSAASAIHMDGGVKVLFDGPSQYTHGGALNDTTLRADAHGFVCVSCPAGVTLHDPRFRHVTTLSHNDALVVQALQSSAPSAAVSPTAGPPPTGTAGPSGGTPTVPAAGAASATATISATATVSATTTGTAP